MTFKVLNLDIGLTLFLSFLMCVILAYIVSQRKPKNFPPGPWGFPVLGHLPLLGLEPHKTTAAWISKYGPIVGIDFASFPCVIISDYKLAKEAYAMPEFCGRPKFQIFARRFGGIPEGFTFTSGRTTREQRAFTQRRLRQLGGFGTKSMESIIVQQAQEMIEGLKQKVGKAGPVNTHCTFNIAFFNTLWILLAGETFTQSDPTILHFTRLVVDGFANNNVSTMLSMFIPWFAKYFPNWLTRDDHLDNIFKASGDLFQPYVDDHWKTRVPGEPRDFIDAYIDEIELTKDTSSSFYGTRGKNGLISNLCDLFMAGVETTGSTLSWLCLLMASYPEVQKRLLAEIDAKIEYGRVPSLEDRAKMPYTEAVIHEVLRFRTLLPFSVFHSTIEPVHFHGFDIPKDTMVYINVYEAHYNRELWVDPENFYPERWLGANGGECVRREGFMPFSTGKRVCLGEQLARDQLFLFTASIFQVFQLELDLNSPAPSLEPKLGGTTMSTRPHELIYKFRNL